MSITWETLRKQARQLENEIDSKLVAFSKLSSSFSSSSGPNSNNINSNNNNPNNQQSSDLHFGTLSNELEESLKKLTVINNRMSDILNSDDHSGSASLSSGNIHTLQRHRDILGDYSTEFEKTKRNIISLREREKLLTGGSSSRDRDDRAHKSNLNNRRMDGSNGENNSSTSLYMKEYDHLKSSHNLVDQQLEMAESTKEKLTAQRVNLRIITQKMNTLANKFPMIGNLVKRIQFKQKKDTIVLSIVISLCLILMLLYIF